MADVNKNSVGGSPWDELLDEVSEQKRLQPTVIGDLDSNKQAGSGAVSGQKPTVLNVPTDVAEKVGAKIDASAIKPAQEPVTDQKTGTAESRQSPDDFWQSVYGQPDSRAEIGSKESIPPAQSTVQQQAAPPPPVSPSGVEPAVDTIGSSNLAQIAPKVSNQQKIPNLQPQIPKPPATRPTGGKKWRLVLFEVIGVFLLLFFGIFLTEQGIISFGLEKVYGAVRLEMLWGGLPASPEKAFLLSAAKMNSKQSFKIGGSADITVNKSVKSDLIGPIVSAIALPVVSFQDEELGSKIQALLTAADLEGDFSPTDSGETISNEQLFSEDSQALEQASSQTADVSNQSTSQTSNQTTSQSTSQTTAETQSITPNSSTDASSLQTVEEISTEISAGFSPDISGTTINLKTKKNPNGKIEIVYSNGKMYLKTSDEISYYDGSKSSWLSYELKSFANQSPSGKFLSTDFSASNFSISGSRVGSETVGGVRCFHYKGKVITGNALDSFEIKENSVSSIDFEFWSGIKDHMVRKIEAEITPNSSFAVSRIDLKLNFSDFGAGSGSYSVPTSPIAVGVSDGTVGGSATSASAMTEKQRDTQRKADLAKIAKALGSYRVANDKYPKTEKSEKVSKTSGILYQSLVKTYIEELPIDPSDPKYYYGYGSDSNSYKLSAVLEDKTDKDGKTVGNVFLYFLSSQ